MTVARGRGRPRQSGCPERKPSPLREAGGAWEGRFRGLSATPSRKWSSRADAVERRRPRAGRGREQDEKEGGVNKQLLAAEESG